MITRRTSVTSALAAAAASLAFFQSAALAAQPPDRGARAPTQASAAAHVVELIAEDYALSAPDEIPAGWTTFRFRNQGEEPHFVLVTRLPEGITIEHYERELSAAFNRAWIAVRDGELEQDEAASRLFASLPDWYPAVQFMGGPGMTAPGLVSETTLDLAPGNYVLECYMKTEAGEFHYMEGMIRPLRVGGTRSAAAPPAADIRITLSNFDMAIEGDLTPGRRVVAVHIAENPADGFGHNVHVARLEPATEVSDVVGWMNAFAVDGLRSPGPATFIGGAQIMPAGSTAYFTIDLQAGRHLFISEYTGHLGVLSEITVRP